VMTNPGLHNPAVVRPAGTVDHSVNVLTARGASGRVAAVLADTACRLPPLRRLKPGHRPHPLP
jgi:hypothetical protein